MLVVVACKGKKPQQQVRADPSQDKPVANRPKDSTVLAHELWDKKDSIYKVKVLEEALSYADKHKDHPFHHRFFCNVIGTDTGENVTVNMRYGHLFNNDDHHLIISREYMYGKIDVYLLKNGRFEHQLSNEAGMQYLENNCRDINGDGAKDFVSHWYPTSGCCRRNVYQVYLYQPVSHSFTSMYEFLNPTFDPKARLIRGVEYGHPGETGLYKYRWNGLNIDTIEYIYRLKRKNGVYIRTKHQIYMPDSSEGIVFRSMPSEYRRIDDYDWFVMNE